MTLVGHGGSVTWDELILVIGLYSLLAMVLLAGRRGGVVSTPDNELEQLRQRVHKGAAITVADVSHRYGRDWVLGHIELTIAEGEAVALVGGNGAGKTTLLSLLSGAESPTAGHVVIDGVLLRAAPERAAALVGVVNHQALLYPRLTIRENLEFFAELFNLSSSGARIDRTLTMVAMTSRQHDRVDQLSHGQRQRVAFARALLHDPQVLLLDEPYAGLDLVAAERLDDLLGELRRGGYTIVMTSHDFDRGYELADRLVMLDGGNIVDTLRCDQVERADALARYRAALGARA